MVPKERVRAIFAAKDAVPWAIAAALFLLVLGDVMTPKLANFLLVVAVLAIGWGVFFNERLEDGLIRTRLFWAVVVTIGPALFVYFALWTPIVVKPIAPKTLALTYKVNMMPVAPVPLENPTPTASHDVRILCDLTNHSAKDMSLAFTMLIKAVVDGKKIEFPAYGTWQSRKDDPVRSKLVNVPRWSAVLDGVWTFRLPDPKKVGFDFDSWEEVGCAPIKLQIKDEVTGIVDYTDNLMFYPWKKGSQGDLPAAFEDWRKVRKEQGAAAGTTPIIGSADDFMRTLQSPQFVQPSKSE